MALKAEALMRAHGWVPSTAYPGALEQWPCRCGVCGNQVEVTFAKVQDRGQDRCGPCSKEALSARLLAGQAQRAIADLVAADWEPLASYPGAHRGWKALHGVCGQIRYPRLSEIRAGEVCCSACNGSVRLSDEEAAEFMRSAGFKPLEPYPGSQVPWRAQCLRCGAIGSPRYSSARKGVGCLPCGEIKKWSSRRANFSVQAEAEMRAVGLEPLEACPGTLARWRCRHVACGREVYPIHHLARVGRGVCRQCSGSPLIEAAEAVERITTLGFRPLEPYPGGTKARWRMQCLSCELVVTKKIQGAGGCRSCRPFGASHGLPALVYVLHHPELNAVKVGITNIGTTRLADHRRGGWNTTHTEYFATGADAYDVEQAVLRQMRIGLGIPPFVSPGRMRQGGATETADAALIPADGLWALVLQARDRIDTETTDAYVRPPAQ
ncbi:hypothetical protein ACFW1A_00625 [Kitasatospora sp. NPDC058965]|uniref:hypothetical protein n=1 Tax=Kitasatospora sp. NPDC058965 TaxID=3346682 RepID=UPI0036A5F7FF